MNKTSVKELLTSSPSVVIYGYGYNGVALEKLLLSFGCDDYKIVDDSKSGERICKLNQLEFTQKTVMLISISDQSISSRIKEECLALGLEKVFLISELDFRAELLDMGYRKVDNNVKYNNDCHVCGGNSIQFFINMSDYELVKCVYCEHIYVRNLEKIDSIGFYEENEDYYRNIFYDGLDNFRSSSFLEPDSYIANRLELMNHFFKTPVEKDSGARFLELGCLDGRLLFYLKQCGLFVNGCEVNKPVARYAQEVLGIDIATEELCNCNFEERYFDYIFSSHVLEHLKDPVGEMKLMAKLLKVGGKSIHHLPCEEDDYENAHHLHFFSKKSIIELHMRLFGNVEHFTTLAQRGDGSTYDVITIMSTKEKL